MGEVRQPWRLAWRLSGRSVGYGFGAERPVWQVRGYVRPRAMAGREVPLGNELLIGFKDRVPGEGEVRGEDAGWGQALSGTKAAGEDALANRFGQPLIGWPVRVLGEVDDDVQE